MGLEKLKYKIKHNIERYIQRQIIDSIKKTNKNDYILRSEYEPIVISICRNSIKNKSAELSLTTYGKRFVTIESEEIDIIIDEKIVDIINHKYHYSVPICKKSYNTIVNMFDGYVELKRKIKEDNIRSNVKYSLNIINDRLKPIIK